MTYIKNIKNTEVDRSHLGFIEAVLSAFDFLTKEYGFHCVKADNTWVRYESKSVFVNIYHELASYELEVEIGLLDELEYSYSIGEIIELMAAQKETRYSFFQASTPERVKKYITELAKLVRKYATSALYGDTHYFKQLEKISLQIAEMVTKKYQLSSIRAEAIKAWQEKNYTKLVKLYKLIKEDLTPAEAKKLEYAKKRLGK